MNGIVSWILEIIIGVIDIYICSNQIINESVRFQLLPSFNLQKDDDIYPETKKDYTNNSN